MLYFAFCKLMARSYEEAFDALGACVTDMRLSDDELLMLSYFNATMDDSHPNAHACRLKLRCCLIYAPIFGWPFALDKEYSAYISKLSHVSQACRCE